MAKLLIGQELAEFIKERQLKAVRGLTPSKIIPKLAVVQIKDDPIINTYVRLKKKYGSDIGVQVDTYNPAQVDAPKLIKTLNNDSGVHGIIVQLPIENSDETDKIVNLVSPEKDVDALAKNSKFQPATPTAILWLLAGHNIDLSDKKVLIIGRGKLVGQPLNKMLKDSGVSVRVADRETSSLPDETLWADVIITATGSPAILYPKMVKQGAVVIDAGVASESGQTVGDLDSSIYEREDLTLTPKKGGVGPLTVSSLFENVIVSAKRAAAEK
ncbi:MAG TPA: bifunctional 5,10-methylenetetrahydrofolate dehydrogenase/5,10-methenyltetrahydrofolate cyclohydrolase [Candidatus Saccharimonadales bacterium]|nr:bifunctional 5,10-methylenetetrahydrofolate dehydrogenase/5,10-methenyltetrahydrofolate cyclohydrolase [Candidatus Saccharimonadales bacterium]